MVRRRLVATLSLALLVACGGDDGNGNGQQAETRPTTKEFCEEVIWDGGKGYGAELRPFWTKHKVIDDCRGAVHFWGQRKTLWIFKSELTRPPKERFTPRDDAS